MNDLAPRQWRQRGVVLFDESALARLTRMPAHWRLIGFQLFPLRLAIGLHVEGDGLPECAHGAEPPIIDPPPPAALDVDRVAAEIRAAMALCDHPDPAGLIYQRVCPACAAAAVVALYGAPPPADE
jgi:hypothetical protein